MYPVAHLLAQATQTVTQNPNAADTWINRIYTLIPIFGAIGFAARWLSKRFHEAVREQVKPVEVALQEHTNAEASIVRDVVQRELAPVITAQTQLSGSVATLSGSVATLTALANRVEDRAKS